MITDHPDHMKNLTFEARHQALVPVIHVTRVLSAVQLIRGLVQLALRGPQRTLQL